MATTTLGFRPRQIVRVVSRGGLECAASRRSAEVRLAVDGVLPADLDGCFLQARPHPADGSSLVDGIGLRGGVATRFRATDTGTQPCPFGPVPQTAACGASAVAARPVPDGVDPVWHTVVTAPGREYGEHQILDGVGQVLHTRSFPLLHSPLVHALAVTARYVVVLDLPVAYSQAAALVGERDPYIWQPNRGARIGLVPRSPEQVAAPVWFDIRPGYALQVVGARDEPGRVLLDAVWHQGSFDLADPGSLSGPVVRWTLDLRSRLAAARQLTGPVRHAVTDQGRPNHLFGVTASASGAGLFRNDLGTGEVATHALGPGLAAGQPVLVPKTNCGGQDGACWLLLPVERVATREQELLVLDGVDLAAGPVAVVRVPAGPRPAAHSVWVNLGDRGATAR
jgi:carotenoid cleavage dioxygenase-like enzyme